MQWRLSGLSLYCYLVSIIGGHLGLLNIKPKVVLWIASYLGWYNWWTLSAQDLQDTRGAGITCTEIRQSPIYSQSNLKKCPYLTQQSSPIGWTWKFHTTCNCWQSNTQHCYFLTSITPWPHQTYTSAGSVFPICRLAGVDSTVSYQHPIQQGNILRQ